jgi:alpha-N-acetylglucosaminidase
MIPTNEEDHDVATVKMDGDKIHLAASSATAMGYALHAYLKTVLHTQLDWDNHALKLPPVLPPVTSPLNMKKSTKYTYYLNVCTHSYTMWSWNWAQWENHIDWMVLNGINMPLAITGQEKIWQETFRRYNVTSLDRFFSGADFLAWQRMGNIRGSWGDFGPLPTHFIEEQHILQLQLLERYRIFGMLPALPAFSGHVPEAMHLLYPMASMRQSERWAGYEEKYTCVWMLDPTDPLFLDIGKTFLDVQRALYGNYTSHIYQTDTYNELLPHTSDHAYLHASSKAVIDSMRASDPNAIWLMQGWLFEVSSSWWTQDKIKAYLDGVPNNQLIVLDLWRYIACKCKVV